MTFTIVPLLKQTMFVPPHIFPHSTKTRMDKNTVANLQRLTQLQSSYHLQCIALHTPCGKRSFYELNLIHIYPIPSGVLNQQYF